MTVALLDTVTSSSAIHVKCTTQTSNAGTFRATQATGSSYNGFTLVDTATIVVYDEPNAPASVAASGVNDTPEQVTVTWGSTGSNLNAIDNFVVQYSDDDGSSWTTASNAITSGASTYTVMGLEVNGATYDFQVAGINDAGTGAQCRLRATMRWLTGTLYRNTAKFNLKQ